MFFFENACALGPAASAATAFIERPGGDLVPVTADKPMTHKELAERAPSKVFRDLADTPGVEIRVKRNHGAVVS